MSKVLIVVDMQNDFVHGVLSTPEAKSIIPNVEAKLRQYYESDSPIIFTMDTHDTSYLESLEGKHLPVEHCIYGCDGWKIIPEFQGYANMADKVLKKYSFAYDDWDYEFKNGRSIESFEFVGVCTDICVISNVLALKAHYPDIPIIVDASCCAGSTPENHCMALRIMKSCHIDIINE